MFCKIQNKGALLLVIYLCWRDSFFPIPLPQSAHYLIMGYFAVLAVMKGFKLASLSLLFVLTGAMSIVLANPDPIFQPWERWIAFTLLMMAAGPLNCSIGAMNFRAIVFKYALLGMVFMSVGSLGAYFTGNGMFYHGAGFFKGLYNHSMTLGPMAAISSAFTLQLFLTDSVKSRRKWWLVLVVSSTLMCMLASSRTAFVALLGAVFVLLWKVYKGRRAKMWGLVVTAAIVLTLTMPLWNSFTDGMAHKQSMQSVEDNSRTELWLDRIAEWKDSPVFGQGFAAFNLDVIKGGSFNTETGGVEPGSSWLFVLSSLGGVGFLLLLLLTVLPTLNLISRKDIKPDSVAMTALLTSVIFIIHMLSEGYIISAGGVICFFAWLTFAVIRRDSIDSIDLCNKKWISREEE